MLLSLSFLPSILLPLLDDADAMNLLISQSMKSFFSQSINQSTSELTNRTISHLVYDVKRAINQSEIDEIRLIDRFLQLRISSITDVTRSDDLFSINQSIDQLYQQSINQSINQSTRGCIKRVALSQHFNARLTLPNSVTHVVFGFLFNQSINRLFGAEPSISHLAFDSDYEMEARGYFNQSLRIGDLPVTLTHLTFGHDFDQPLIDSSMSINQSINQLTDRMMSVLPDSLVYLRFNGKFNQPLIGLPSSLEKLILNEFNQPLYSITNQSTSQSINQSINQSILPPHLTHLKFGFKFDLPLCFGCLPSTLTHLMFGAWFNKPIDIGVLPDSLTDLRFDSHGSFNQSIGPGVLPPRLVSLHLGRDFNQPIEVDMLPHTLTYLHLGNRFDQSLTPGVLPKSLTWLNFGYFFDQPLVPGVIPAAVNTLTLGRKFSQQINSGSLPSSVTHVTLGSSLSHSVSADVIQSVTHLKLDLFFKDPIPAGSIPASVTHLSIGDRYNVLIPRISIPSGVKHLLLGDSFNQPLCNLPHVAHLVLGISFTQPISGVCLPALTHITVRGPYKRSLGVGDIPCGVTHVEFMSATFDGVIEAGALPDSVTHLRFPSLRQLLCFSALPPSLLHFTCLHEHGCEHDVDALVKAGINVCVLRKSGWGDVDASANSHVFERVWSDPFAVPITDYSSVRDM